VQIVDEGGGRMETGGRGGEADAGGGAGSSTLDEVFNDDRGGWAGEDEERKTNRSYS